MFVSCLLRGLLVTFALALSSSVFAATYYVDPQRGKMANDGTSSRPWRTLQEVFTARKTFRPGDVILLRNGFHGSPVVSGRNSGTVTIRPDHGHQPKLREILFINASHWTLVGLDISPQHAGRAEYDKGRLIDLKPGTSHITIKDCHLRSVFSVRGWSVADWKAGRLGTAIYSQGAYSVISGNRIENVAQGITIAKQATHSTVQYNVIDTVRDDGYRALADHCIFEYNTLSNMYAIDGNHDDAFQSWSSGPGGPGSGVISNVVVRGNIFISYTDPKQPFKASMQGIGCFDGMYENWVIENNVIVTDQWHGISLFGARNCRVLNNTVVKTPINARKNAPWIKIEKHKRGTASSGNTVRNNLATAIRLARGTSDASHNLATHDYASHFKNHRALDLRLKPSSAAVNGGTKNHAPALDADQKPRRQRVDIGAYQADGVGSRPPKAPAAAPQRNETKPAKTVAKPPANKPGASKAAAAKRTNAGAKKPAVQKATSVSFEAEQLARSARGAGAKRVAHASASGGGFVTFNGNSVHDAITFTTGTLQPGRYRLKVRLATGRNRAQASASFRGAPVGGRVDNYGTSGGFREVSLGQVQVTRRGTQTVTLTVTGKQKASKGYELAIDRVSFQAL